MLLLYIEVCGHLFMHSSLNIPLVEVWTLTGPVQDFDSFLFAGVLGIIVLLHDPISAKL